MFIELVTNHDNLKNTITLYNKNKIKLPYKNRHFQIRYTDLGFGIKKTFFQYRLKEHNEEWIYNESNKLISFSNVPPGRYVLQLKASNDNILWETALHEFTIEIIPAFCKPWLFRIATLGLIIYLIWYAIGLRIKAIKKAARFRQELAQSEATALKAQMNPHFLFNSLNAIDKYILNNDSAKASDYLSKFSKLIRRILDYSNQSLITLEQEIAIIKLYVKME